MHHNTDELPPEDEPGEAHGYRYCPFKADVWAAGVTLFCFVVGKLPFWADTAEVLYMYNCLIHVLLKSVPCENAA
jgi:hypothetical protein